MRFSKDHKTPKKSYLNNLWYGIQWKINWNKAIAVICSILRTNLSCSCSRYGVFVCNRATSHVHKISVSFVSERLLQYTIIWGKVFKNGPSKICGKQPSKNFTWSILECLDPFICNSRSFIKYFIVIIR